MLAAENEVNTVPVQWLVPQRCWAAHPRLRVVVDTGRSHRTLAYLSMPRLAMSCTVEPSTLGETQVTT